MGNEIGGPVRSMFFVVGLGVYANQKTENQTRFLRKKSGTNNENTTKLKKNKKKH